MAIDAYISFNLLIKQGFSFYREVDYHQGMWNLNYDSPKEIERVLNERGLAMSKKFGQNFLISPEGRKRLIDLMELESGMKVWEIGPGLGAITHMLIQKKVDLTSFEIDHGFASLLTEVAFNDEENFTLIENKFPRGISHGDMIDLFRENIKGFDIREFYTNIALNLKNMGY